MKKVFFIFIIYLTITSGLFAQDPLFSQFYNTPTHVNPAFAGTFNTPFITINYRNQWPSINNVYNTYAISYDQFFNTINSGFGLKLISDNQGDGSLVNNNIGILYSYQIKINDDYMIKLGLEGDLIQSRLDWSKLVFGDNLHPQYGYVPPGGITISTNEIGPNNFKREIIDISTGMLLYSKKFYLGMSLKHINSPETGFLENNSSTKIGIHSKYTIHGGYTHVIRKDYHNKKGTFISPVFIASLQGDFFKMNLGIYNQLEQFVWAANIRYAYSNFDAITLAAGWKFQQYKMMYSYDVPISRLGLNSGGAHEIGIIINFNEIYPNKSRSIDCFELLY